MFKLAGVIDADYRGNVGVVLFNYSDSDFTSKTIFIFK
jgi:dUTPase